MVVLHAFKTCHLIAMPSAFAPIIIRLCDRNAWAIDSLGTGLPDRLI